MRIQAGKTLETILENFKNTREATSWVPKEEDLENRRPYHNHSVKSKYND